MSEVPEWMMGDGVAEEWLAAACDECGLENGGCECVMCSECSNFGVGALTKDQNLTLCEDCAEDMEVELQ